MKRMAWFRALVAATWMGILVPHSAAVAAEGLRFSHHDWELACDNTLTCRAAGYQTDADEQPVSLLLTRQAGPRQAVTGQLMLGESDDLSASFGKLATPVRLVLRVNGQDLGAVPVDKVSRTGTLSAAQVLAVLTALPKTARIEWRLGDQVWRVSDRGAAAVLLKMDEFQGRLGTAGALVRRGDRSEDQVLPAQPLPTVRAARLPKPQPTDKQFVARHGQALQLALRKTVKEDDCPDLFSPQPESADWEAVRLTASRMLVEGRCWSAAYNTGSGFWVVNNQPPFDPVLVTANGTERVEHTLLSVQKGRGLGDCFNTDEWTWTGSGYVHTRSTSTGLCKLVSPGGAWDLPTRVTHVQ